MGCWLSRKVYTPVASFGLVPLGDHDGQALIAFHEGGIAAFGLARDDDFREAIEDFFPNHFELKLGQPVADAAIAVLPLLQSTYLLIQSLINVLRGSSRFAFLRYITGSMGARLDYYFQRPHPLVL